MGSARRRGGDGHVRLCRRSPAVPPGARHRWQRPRSPTEQCRVLLGLATASYRSSDVDAALAACCEAAALAERIGRPDLQAEAAIVVEPMLLPEVNVQLRRLCETALTALPGDGAGTACPGHRSARRRLPLPRRPRGRACGVRPAPRPRPPVRRSRGRSPSDCTRNSSTYRDRTVSRSDERLAEQLLCVARELADPTETAAAHLWLVDVALQHGDIARAGRELAIGSPGRHRQHRRDHELAAAASAVDARAGAGQVRRRKPLR